MDQINLKDLYKKVIDIENDFMSDCVLDLMRLMVNGNF